ncbi:MAG: response regulator [Pseudomonadota bacterium]
MKSATLLIVEDQAVIAADLEERLLRNGYRVCGIAASGEEAVCLAREHRPGLALMDIRLQGEMDGIATAKVLRRELDIPVIFLSSHSDNATLQRAKAAAPYGFLVKPFEERELQLNIEVTLHKHKGDRQLAAAHHEICRLNANLEQGVQERTAELEAALAEIEGVVHAVAHHLRSPLRAMEGYSHLLMTHTSALPDSASRFPEAISSNARRMACLVDDLLAFLNIRKQPLYPTRVNIADEVRAVLRELVAAEPGRVVEIHIDELPMCQADPTLLRCFLIELLSNTLKFTRERVPAIITVSFRPHAEQRNHHVYFVRDNGIGFDARYADKLFKLFSQLNRPEAYEGTGAGLAMALRIVERMGGRIWAESPPERGAIFFFTLPISP